MNAETQGTGRSRLPLAAMAVGLVMLAYFLGWLVGLGAGRTSGHPTLNPFVILTRLWIGLLWPLAICLVIFLASASVGNLLLGLIRLDEKSPLARMLFSVALGLAVTAYAVLGLGMLGILDSLVFWGLMLLLLAAGARPLARLLAEAAGQWREWTSSWSRFDWALALAGGGIVVIGLLCAGTPVLDYDTLSYHLGAPGEHFMAGRIRFLSHNVYANFPEHVEMLYLLGIVLSGSKLTGMAVAVLIEVVFGVASAAAIGLMASRFLGRRAGLPAAVFFLACPVFVVQVICAHIELALCFYTALVLLAVMQWVFGGDAGRGKWIVLAGLYAGLAVAVKYTALLTLCLPLGVAVLAVSLARGRGAAGKLLPPMLLAACALLAVLPWFIRNLVHAGNPVFPLLYDVFGARGWPAHQAAKFVRPHAPIPVFDGEHPLLGETWRFLTGHVGEMSPGFTGPLAVLFIPVLLLLLFGGRRREQGEGLRGRPLVFVAGYWVAFVLLWGLATHRIARFLAPSLVALVPLSAVGFAVGVGRGGAVGKTCRALALACAVFGLYVQLSLAYMWGGLGGTMFGERMGDLAREAGLSPYAETVEGINDPRNVPPDARVMLVGEDRTYYFERRVVYSAVFNDHPIEPALRLAREGQMQRAVEALRATGVTHVVVNWSELRRLATTYSYYYEGQKRQGYLPEVDLETREPLLGLLSAAGRKVAGAGRMSWPREDSPEKVPLLEVYDVRALPRPAPYGSAGTGNSGPTSPASTRR